MIYNFPDLGGSSGAFPQPWFDYASLQMPATITDALKLCEFVVSTQPSYRSAIERVVSYFITEIEILSDDAESRKKYKSYFEDTLGIYHHLKAFGLDFLTYGNAFVSIVRSLHKYYACGAKDCGFQAPALTVLDEHIFEAKWSSGKITAKCPQCHRRTEWTSIESVNISGEKLQIKRWSPHEIDIEYCPYSDAARYVWRIPPYFRDLVKRGSPIVLATTPNDIIDICLNNDYLRFYPGEIFHAKEPTLAGLVVRGWGISRVLSHFRQAWLLAIYHRHNEAIALDYIMPVRIICPEAKSPLFDPALISDYASVIDNLNDAIKARRVDPTKWVSIPFPVRYQFIGAEGTHLAPVGLIEQAKVDLLDSIGVPIELYRANLSLGAGPIAIRLFESSWSHLLYMYNQLLQWIADKVAAIFSWDKVKVRLVRPSLFDDIQRQMARLQLMASGLISKTTGLKALGIDLESELHQSLEDEKLIAVKTQKTQEELSKLQSMQEMLATPPAAGGGPMDLSALMGAAGGGGGAPEGGGPTAGAPDAFTAMLAQLDMAKQSPTDLDKTADTLAQMIYASPAERRNSMLRQLNQRNPTVHAIVKEKLRELDTAAEREGRIMGRAMAAQQAAAQGPMPPGMGM